MPAANSVAPPACAGRDDDAREAIVEDIGAGEPAAEIGLDIGHALDLLHPVIADPAPGGEAGQPALVVDPAAEHLAGFGERHGIAAIAERPRAFEARRTGADDEHAVLGRFRRNDFGMPVLAPFLADRR